MVIFAVLAVFDDWYTVGTVLVVTIGTPMVLTVLCTNRQKQSKDSQNNKNDHWCTNRHMSTVYAESAEYTKPLTDISATVTPIGMKFCMTVNMGSGQVSSLGPQGAENSKF